MKIPVYCIKDDYLGFQTPWCQMNEAAACRDFENVCTKADTVYCQHKELFNLYQIGIFDNESGLIEPDVKFIQAGTVFER